MKLNKTLLATAVALSLTACKSDKKADDKKAEAKGQAVSVAEASPTAAAVAGGSEFQVSGSAADAIIQNVDGITAMVKANAGSVEALYNAFDAKSIALTGALFHNAARFAVELNKEADVAARRAKILAFAQKLSKSTEKLLIEAEPVVALLEKPENLQKIADLSDKSMEDWQFVLDIVAPGAKVSGVIAGTDNVLAKLNMDGVMALAAKDYAANPSFPEDKVIASITKLMNTLKDDKLVGEALVNKLDAFLHQDTPALVGNLFGIFADLKALPTQAAKKARLEAVIGKMAKLQGPIMEVGMARQQALMNDQATQQALASYSENMEKSWEETMTPELINNLGMAFAPLASLPVIQKLQ